MRIKRSKLGEMMSDAKILNLADFVKIIYSIEVEKPWYTAPEKLLFRGHSSERYELKPSLARKPNGTWQNGWESVEIDLVHSAQQKFPTVFPDSDYPAILLAKLQHYGIYTRMLDFTDNALVALYFACKNNMDTDGEVIVVHCKPYSVYNPDVNAIADTYRLTRNAEIYTDDYFYKVIHQDYYSSYLAKSMEYKFDEWLDSFIERIKNPIFVEVGNLCERQKNQSGHFLLFPNKITDKVENDLVEIEKDSDFVECILTIPKELKKAILEQLTRFGITEEFLFADSVDDVCKCIMRKHEKYFPE